MNKHICVHGHFYQPPRENPWLEAIELQDSAYPYNDWNERITAECYKPNTASRILNAESKIVDIINNYSRISFNFGPTLLSWMEKYSPKVYRLILDADLESIGRFSGHGSAIAQVYNHMILPLANERDKKTQVYWGIRDFEHRFRRKPEGLWLAETAVDIKTLEVVADHEIKFIILSPYQVKKVRKIGDAKWTDATGGKIDPKLPYLCNLPSGKKITIFFYDGPLSQEIAFGDLLKDGEKLLQRFLSLFPQDDSKQNLVHIGVDGETFGHHHKFGNMALAYALNKIETNKLANLTIYGEYLEKCPPKYEVEVIENSSWSCSHGVERWRSNCGCCIAYHEKWTQEWRKHLRDSMDWLRDNLIPVYEKEMGKYMNDVWALRNDYIEIIHDRSIEKINEVLLKHIKNNLSHQDKVKIIKLLEMQRHALLMYTSCGWFFDDISRIETIQIMQYSARAIQLAKKVCGIDLEEEYINKLEKAKSNIKEYEDGKKIYARFVKPAIVDLLHVGAHYAISSLFEKYPKKVRIYSYTINNEKYDLFEAGKQKLIIGKAYIRSEITLSDANINFALFHLGDHNLIVGVKADTNSDFFSIMHKELKAAFRKNDIPMIISLITNHFDENTYSLWDLFKNEQGKAMNKIFEETLDSIEGHFRKIYEDYYPLMQVKNDIQFPLPKSLAMTVEFVLNRDLCDLLEKDDIDIDKLDRLAREIKRWSFMRDKDSVSLIANRKINNLMEKFLESPEDIILLKNIEATLRTLEILSLDWDLWESQNIYFKISEKLYKSMLESSKKDLKKAKNWIKFFDKIGNYLKITN